MDYIFNNTLVKENKNNVVYQNLLKKIFAKITINNKKNNFKLTTDIPTYCIGYTSYDMKTALVYIMKYLRSKDFYVKYLYPNILFISWQHKITNKHKKYEIMKMKPKYEDGFNKKEKLDKKLVGEINNMFYKNNNDNFEKELDSLDYIVN